MMELQTYLDDVAAITAVNPAHQKMVSKLAQLNRRVDFHVDQASGAQDVENEKLERKHLALEQKYFDAMLDVETQLPKYEVANFARQFMSIFGRSL